ncbi:DegV family protein [Erysipelothrix rhusiopathiae]|nr:DegV family protein [Erysipelothrix rhusiopathiae]
MREGYDHIFALSIGTALSGTYSSMEMVKQDLKIDLRKNDLNKLQFVLHCSLLRSFYESQQPLVEQDP